MRPSISIHEREDMPWPEVTLPALHTENNAKPCQFLQLLLKSKEQKDQIKYLDLLLLRILSRGHLHPEAP